MSSDLEDKVGSLDIYKLDYDEFTTEVAKMARLQAAIDKSKSSDAADDYISDRPSKPIASALEDNDQDKGKSKSKDNVPNEIKVEKPPRKAKQGGAAAELVAMGKDMELFHDSTKEPHAVVEEEGIRRIVCIKHSEFREVLSRQFYLRHDAPPNSQAVNSAIETLSAFARLTGKCHPLNVRYAMHEGSIWIDLGTPKWDAIRVDSLGWRLVDRPPILFKRYNHMLPMCYPKEYGCADDLCEDLFTNIEHKHSRILLQVWAVTAMVPNIPRPILVLHGPQGSGKTTVSRLLGELLDPSEAQLLSIPRDENQLVQNLTHHGCPIFDNQGMMKRPMSDAFCRGATGAALSKRKLYTDDDDIIMKFKRPIILNGVHIPTVAPDFMDRCILVELERIPPQLRNDEFHIQAKFNARKSFIFTGMLNALSRGLAGHYMVEKESPTRLVDFFNWGYVIANSVWKKGELFITALKENEDYSAGEVLSEDPLVHAIENILHEHYTNEWSGSPTALFEELSTRHNNESKYDYWPRNASALARRLRELQSPLLDIGIKIQFPKGRRYGRVVNLSLIGDKARPVSSMSSTSSDKTLVSSDNACKTEISGK